MAFLDSFAKPRTGFGEVLSGLEQVSARFAEGFAKDPSIRAEKKIARIRKQDREAALQEKHLEASTERLRFLGKFVSGLIGEGADPGKLQSINALIDSIVRSSGNDDLIVQEAEIAKLAFQTPPPGQEEPDPESPIGKLQFDRRAAVEQFGEDSPQVQQIDAVIGQATTEDQDGGPFGGRGFQAQSANQVISLADRLRQGQALSPTESSTYAIAYQQLTAPRQIVDPASGAISLIIPTLDEKLFPKPGASSVSSAQVGAPAVGTVAQSDGRPQFDVRQIGSPGKLPPERAGRISMIEQAVTNVANIRSQLVDENGNVDRSLVLSMTTDIPFAGKGLPFTQGRLLRAQYEDGAAAKLRLETGAQANETELQNIIDRFMPSLLDDDATIIDKLDRMEKFFSTSLRLSDPELFKKMSERARNQGNIPEPPAQESDATFAGFDLKTGFAIFERSNGSKFMVDPNG